MSFVFPLLFIVFGSGSIIMISKRRFEEVLPVFLMFSILIVFLSGFLNQLLIGYLIAIALAVVFPVFTIIQWIKRKDLSDLRKRMFTPGFCIFIIIYVFIYILNYNRGFIMFDEISHWGPMVKETLRLDKFYSIAESGLSVHKDYPPAVSLFEALWCKLCGGYKEAYLYTSLEILTLSLFFPSLAKFDWGKKQNSFIKLILLVIIILSANVVIDLKEGSFYQSIYIDCFLGLLFGYCLFLVFHEKQITKFGIFRLAVALSVLLLTKQMGMVFYLIVLMAFAVNYFIIHRLAVKDFFRRKPARQEIFSIVAVLICLLLIPAMFMFSWNAHVSANDLSRQFNISDIKIFDLPGIAMGTSGEAYQHTAFVNFVKSILEENLFVRPIPLSFWQLMLLAAVAFYLICKYGCKYFEKHQIHGLNSVICIGAIGYAFSMLLLYVFAFGSYQGPKLSSHYRYLNTYWLAVFGLAIMLFLYIIGKKEKGQKKTGTVPLASAVILLLLVLCEPATITYLVPRTHYYSVTIDCQEDADIIINNTEETDSIFIIAQHNNGYIKFKLTYLTLPRYYSWSSLGKPYNENDAYTIDLSEEQWLSKLSKYDYLYLYAVDDQFIENYSGAFHSKNEIKNKQLFKIIRQSNGMIDLSLIE